MKRFWLVVVIVIAVGAAALAYYRSGSADATPAYVTAAVTRGDVVETVEATGTLQAVTTVQVGTQVSGTIKALYADFNSRVKKGQIIAELEPSLLQTQVEQARASLVRGQAEAERARVDVENTQTKLRQAQELWNSQLIPRTDLDTAEANAKQAQAAIKSADAQVAQSRASLNQNEVNLGHTIIRAPIDGIVISRNVDVGQTVAASMSAPTLFVIAQDLREMQVNASIGESDIGQIRSGESVTFRVDAYPDETFRGTVAQVRLEPKTESNVVSYMTIIDVPNPDLQLKPGMTATVTIEVAHAEGVLRVPNAALRFRPPAAPDQASTGTQPAGSRGPRVFVLRNGAPQMVPVTTGVSDGIVTAITGGSLTDAEPVITGVGTGPAAAASQGATNPLLPFGGRRGGTQGRQGGSQGARGGGAR